MNSGARHKSQRSNRVRVKADAVVLLDRIVARLDMTARLRLEIAEMRLRLAPPVGVKAPVVLTGYTKEGTSNAQ